MSAHTLRRIWSITRLHCSVNGNPRYDIAFEDDPRRPLRTASDHSFCYAVGNPDMREGSLVRVELTRAGRISDISPATKEDWAALNESYDDEKSDPYAEAHGLDRDEP